MKPNRQITPLSRALPCINTLTRRDFLAHTLRAGAALGLAALTQVPPFARRALAENGIGTNGRKLLFIFLRGANDALNSCLPVKDAAFTQTLRPNIWIPQETPSYYDTPGPCDYPAASGTSQFDYGNAIRVGNGFNGLHPSLRFLAPVYNVGDLVLAHRVGYPRQSRSHFDSQAYWETGEPNSITREGIFYRTLLESGLNATNPLAGVSIQSSLPTSFQGSQLAVTNISDPTRYDLVGTPTPAGDQKLMNAILSGNQSLFADKRSRGLLTLQYDNLVSTLNLFSTIDFSETGNTFIDTDTGFSIFPTSAAKNGLGTAATNVVDAGAFSFFQSLKGAALILNKTGAVIAGTEMGGFDTHNGQGGAAGDHADLLKRVAWAIYGLRRYFLQHHDQVTWNNLVIVTLTEFGRTTAQNSNGGTDHAEAGLMFIAGGGVKGYGKAGRTSGVIGGTPSDPVPWDTGPGGSMFGVAGRYLKRAIDYRSLLGEIIREHLCATQDQLNRIIPGYATENLVTQNFSPIDGTEIMGEVDVI
jgi:uncharacterized protein (DUF1501 family)